MQFRYLGAIGCLLILSISALKAQVTVTSITPTAAVQNVLIGTGVTATNIQYHGATVAIGKFVSNSTSMPLASGIILSTGDVSEISGVASGATISTDNGEGSDTQLAALVTEDVNDASVLEFDFIPESDTIKFRYIFASEEYPDYEYDGCMYNDIFGFFISGPNPLGGSYTNKNIALLPGTNIAVTIQTINHTDNSNLFVDNETSNTLAFNGRSVILTAWALVVPCNTYHIKLAIGDVADFSWDSGVFLEANSFSSPRVAVTPSFQTQISPGNAIEGCSDAIVSIKLPKVPQSEYWLDYSTIGTATPGVDYVMNPDVPDYLVFPAGQDSISINIHPTIDNISEPTETILFIVKASMCYDIFDTVSINIINRDSLLLQVTGDTLVCSADSATLLATTSGGMPPNQYMWNNGVSALTQTLMPVDSVSTYVFTVTDVCNFSAVDSIKVMKSYVDISVRQDTTICEGGSVLLYGSGNGTLNWTNLTGNSPIVSPSQTSKYEASVSNICGVAKDTVTVYVDHIPFFSLGNDTIVCEQHPINIGIEFNSDYQYLWSNGYRSSRIQITDPNLYVLEVTQGVCSFSDSIVIGPGFCNWWIPNAFSPDKSGYNEVFKPEGVEMPQFEMIIYDRWGRIVFQTQDWDQGWDGTIDHERAPIGTYIYQIWGEMSNIKSKVLLKQGDVSLVR
jgi:gliding motility-associated-like protein